MRRQALESLHYSASRVLESIKRNKVRSRARSPPHRQRITSVNVGLRKALDLYANVRQFARCKRSLSLPRTHLVIVREIRKACMPAGPVVFPSGRESENHYRKGVHSNCALRV